MYIPFYNAVASIACKSIYFLSTSVIPKSLNILVTVSCVVSSVKLCLLSKLQPLQGWPVGVGASLEIAI